MFPLVLIAAGALAIFAVYFVVVVSIRKRRDDAEKRAKGLDTSTRV
jgi:hypothetical protein